MYVLDILHWQASHFQFFISFLNLFNVTTKDTTNKDKDYKVVVGKYGFLRD